MSPLPHYTILGPIFFILITKEKDLEMDVVI